MPTVQRLQAVFIHYWVARHAFFGVLHGLNRGAAASVLLYRYIPDDLEGYWGGGHEPASGWIDLAIRFSFGIVG